MYVKSKDKLIIFIRASEPRNGSINLHLKMSQNSTPNHNVQF